MLNRLYHLIRNKRDNVKTMDKREKNGSRGNFRDDELENIKQLFDVTIDAVRLLDTNFTIVATNEIYSQYFGVHQDEMKGKKCNEFLCSTNCHSDGCTIKTILKTGKTVEKEIHYGIPGSEKSDFLFTAVPLKDKNGEINRILESFKDISLIKRTQQALRESEANYRNLSENITDGIFATQNGIFINVNTGMCRIFGYTKQELVDMPSWNLAIPKVREDVKRFFFEKASLKEPASIEAECVTKDNRKIVCEIHTDSYISKDGVFGVVRDVTERKCLEDALKKSHEELERRVEERTRELQKKHDLLNSLSQQVPGVIYQFQLFPDGRFCFPYASEAIGDIYEVSPDEVCHDASKVFAMMHPDDLDGVVDSIQESARTLQPWRYEYRVILPKQGLRWRLSTSRPQLMADGSILWHGYTSDITKRKELQKQLINAAIETEERERNRFAEDIHDELGPLLSTINLYVNALQSPDYNEKQKDEMLSNLPNITKQAIQTAKDVAHNLMPSVLKRYGVVKAIEAFCYDLNMGKGIEINFNSANYKPEVNKNKEIFTYRIINELINNSVKHSKATQINIDIETRNNITTLNYSDNGVGFNFNKTMDNNIKGQGLQNIFSRVKTLEGTIKYFSEPGKGVQVTISFLTNN